MNHDYEIDDAQDVFDYLQDCIDHHDRATAHAPAEGSYMVAPLWWVKGEYPLPVPEYYNAMPVFLSNFEAHPALRCPTCLEAERKLVKAVLQR